MNESLNTRAETQRAMEVVAGCADLLRPESGWMRLIRPHLEEEELKLREAILSGKLSEAEYLTKCGQRKLMQELIQWPEMAQETNRGLLKKR